MVERKSMNSDAISLKLGDLSYLLFGEDMVKVTYESDKVSVIDYETQKNIPAWRWIIRAIAKNFSERNKIGGTINDMKDIAAQFETDGMIIRVVISKGCMLSKEGIQLFSILMDEDLRDMIHKILDMPDTDYRNTIRLFSEISLASDTIAAQQEKEKYTQASLHNVN